MGRWKQYERNIFGNVVKVTEPNPAGGADLVTLYACTATDKLRQVSMTRGSATQTRTWDWNAATQPLTSVTMPESGTTSFVYYSSGLLHTRTDAKGQRVQYTYDSLNRLTAIQRFKAGAQSPDPCQSLAITWDISLLTNQGRITQHTLGRPTKVVWGNPNTQVCAQGEVRELYDYGPAGRVWGKDVRFDRNGVLYQLTGWWIHDNEGRLAEEHYPAGGPKLGYGYGPADGLPQRSEFWWYVTGGAVNKRDAVVSSAGRRRARSGP